MIRIGDKERAYVLEVLDKQFRSVGSTEMITRLESLFAEKFGVDFAISFVNGTATMHAALAAMDVGRGDEVIVPPLTMGATSMAVLQAQATPVYADVEPDTWTISPDSIERAITPRTRAIIPVAIYGLPPDMERIMQIAEQHKLWVVEDDAQCFLGYIHGRVAGSIAHASSFSFQNSKHMTSGEGGMVTTNDAELADRIRRMSSLGYKDVHGKQGGAKLSKYAIQRPDYDRHTSIGWNYRMPELCAAVALAQLEKLEGLVSLRRTVAEYFLEAVDGCGWLQPQHTPEGYRHSWWSFVLRLADDCPVSWRDFHARFIEFGGDSFYGAWKLTYLEPAFRLKRFSTDQRQVFEEGLCPVAESLQPRLFQFKTNYYDLDRAARQAAVLKRTVEYFDGSRSNTASAGRTASLS